MNGHEAQAKGRKDKSEWIAGSQRALLRWDSQVLAPEAADLRCLVPPVLADLLD